MRQENNVLVLLLLPLILFYSLKTSDKRIDKDFDLLVKDGQKQVEENLSSEQRASFNLSPKLHYVQLSFVNSKDYIKYKLKYVYSYITKEGQPEKIFYYYK